MSKTTCAKCGGRMEEGFVGTTTSHGNGVSQWLPGKPQKSIWTGIKMPKAQRRAIEIWRCGRCGYLEGYAP